MLKQLFAAAALMLVLSACGPATQPKPLSAAPDSISAEDTIKLLKENKAPLIIDVREPDELTGPLGMIPGAVNIPTTSFKERMQEFPKDRPVIIVCRSGNRSGRASSILRENGWNNVTNLEGGMIKVREAEKSR